MDSLFFHPKLVHLPMALAVVVPLFAAALAVAWWRGWLPRRAWLVAVALQGLLFVSGLAALRSGEAEEDRVEAVVPEGALEAHEEAAELFVWASGGALLLMLGAFAAGGRRSALPLAAAGSLASVLVLGLGARTGSAGGALVYQHGAAQAYAQGGPDPGVAERGEEDDD